MDEHARLGLEVFDAEVGSQHVLCELLLQFLFDFLAEPLMHKRILRVKLGKHDQLEAPNHPLLCQLELLHYLIDFILAQGQFVKVRIVDV